VSLFYSKNSILKTNQRACGTAWLARSTDRSLFPLWGKTLGKNVPRSGTSAPPGHIPSQRDGISVNAFCEPKGEQKGFLDIERSGVQISAGPRPFSFFPKERKVFYPKRKKARGFALLNPSGITKERSGVLERAYGERNPEHQRGKISAGPIAGELRFPATLMLLLSFYKLENSIISRIMHLFYSV
jgi:hypothetical protein